MEVSLEADVADLDGHEAGFDVESQLDTKHRSADGNAAFLMFAINFIKSDNC